MKRFKCEFTEYLDTLINEERGEYFSGHYLMIAEETDERCIMVFRYLGATRGYVRIDRQGVIKQVCIYMDIYIYKGRIADTVVDLNKRFGGKKLNAVEVSCFE